MSEGDKYRTPGNFTAADLPGGGGAGGGQGVPKDECAPERARRHARCDSDLGLWNNQFALGPGALEQEAAGTSYLEAELDKRIQRMRYLLAGCGCAGLVGVLFLLVAEGTRYPRTRDQAFGLLCDCLEEGAECKGTAPLPHITNPDAGWTLSGSATLGLVITSMLLMSLAFLGGMGLGRFVQFDGKRYCGVRSGDTHAVLNVAIAMVAWPAACFGMAGLGVAANWQSRWIRGGCQNFITLGDDDPTDDIAPEEVHFRSPVLQPGLITGMGCLLGIACGLAIFFGRRTGLRSEELRKYDNAAGQYSDDIIAGEEPSPTGSVLVHQGGEDVGSRGIDCAPGAGNDVEMGVDRPDLGAGFSTEEGAVLARRGDFESRAGQPDEEPGTGQVGVSRSPLRPPGPGPSLPLRAAVAHRALDLAKGPPGKSDAPSARRALEHMPSDVRAILGRKDSLPTTEPPGVARR